MTTPERTAALVAAARRRHDETRRKATDALRLLDAAGQPINFAVVALQAGVSRAWLYRDPTVRAEIDRLRRRTRTASPVRPAAEQATAESRRQQLDALLTREAELRAENQQLRDALARKLGQGRATTTTTTGGER